MIRASPELRLTITSSKPPNPGNPSQSIKQIISSRSDQYAADPPTRIRTSQSIGPRHRHPHRPFHPPRSRFRHLLRTGLRTGLIVAPSILQLAVKAFLEDVRPLAALFSPPTSLSTPPAGIKMGSKMLFPVRVVSQHGWLLRLHEHE